MLIKEQIYINDVVASDYVQHVLVNSPALSFEKSQSEIPFDSWLVGVLTANFYGYLQKILQMFKSQVLTFLLKVLNNLSSFINNYSN